MIDHPDELASQSRNLTVAPGDAGDRLDRWLHRNFPELSRALLQRWVRERRVRVDGAPAKPSTALRVGSVVSVAIPPPAPSAPLPADIPLAILFEDECMIAIDKPAGLVVHSSPGVAVGGSVVNALLHYTSELSAEAGAFRPGIVHRLDRETSGVLVIARTDAAHRHLAGQFKARSVAKRYLACVHGTPEGAEGEIDRPLGRSLTNRKRMAIRHDERGRRAQSRWRVLWGNDRFAWLEVTPTTGRTHQIRVHLKSIGHPIVCDAVYGRERRITRSELLGRTPLAGEAPILARHALHAESIRLAHPRDGRVLEFRAQLPPDLEAVAAAIRP